jgi:hypothetical protein
MSGQPLTEKELRRAFTIYGNMLADSLPADEELAEEHEFSPEFERKMQDMIHSLGKKKPVAFQKPVLRRVAIFAGVMLLGASVMTFSVKAVRTAVTGFFVETFEKFSLIVHIKDDEVSEPDELEQLYKPTYLPDGCVFESETEIKPRYRVVYSNEVNSIVFLQAVKDGTAIDTESAPHEEIQVNSMKGICYEAKGVSHIIWENSCYRFEIYGSIGMEELQKMAWSLELSEKHKNGGKS